MIVPARRVYPLRRNRRTNLRGLGFSYYDLLAQTDREACDPKDSACVARNQEVVNSVQELWNSQYLGKTDAQMGTLPQITVVPTDQTAAFMANQPVDANIYFASGGSYSGAQLQAAGTGTQLPAITPTPVKAPVAGPSSAGTTQAGQVIVTSSGAQTAPGAVAGPLSIGGFSFSAVPWWGWAGLAAGAFFAFGRRG